MVHFLAYGINELWRITRFTHIYANEGILCSVFYSSSFFFRKDAKEIMYIFSFEIFLVMIEVVGFYEVSLPAVL